jgi:hypothetical protein
MAARGYLTERAAQLRLHAERAGASFDASSIDALPASTDRSSKIELAMSSAISSASVLRAPDATPVCSPATVTSTSSSPASTTTTDVRFAYIPGIGCALADSQTATLISRKFDRRLFSALDNAPYCAEEPPNPSVMCTTVPRGGTTTCTATAGGPAFTTNSWKFTGPNNVTVNGPGSGFTWSGTAVQSGTVSVNVVVAGTSYPVSGNLTVNARTNWAFATLAAAFHNAPYTCSSGTVVSQNFTSPPARTNGNLGASCLALAWSTTPATVSGGPNNGYQYLTSASQTAQAEYAWSLNPDLVNSGSTFSQAQRGNYNAAQNRGWISWADLKNGTDRHEAGPMNSHWAQYSAANGGANNLGTVAEPQVGAPGSNFNQQVSNAMQAAANALQTATSTPEPCGEWMDAACTASLGYVNFTPYQSYLAVTWAGPGSGTVTSAPAGINCGATCWNYFNSGGNVVLTATPNAGFNASWGGCSATNGNTCTVDISVDRDVTVTFGP